MNPESGGGCPGKHVEETAWVDHMDDKGHAGMCSSLGSFGPVQNPEFPVVRIVYVIILEPEKET